MTKTPNSSNTGPTQLTRGAFGLGAAALVVGGAVFASRWYNITAQADTAGTLSTPDAHRAAVAGTVLLVDIRRADEWQRTGIGEGAVPLDMRRKDFVQAVLARTGGATDAPIALICARGVRSRGLARRLSDAGFTNIIDVPEGMMGSGAGAGWLRRGLPVLAWQSG